MERLNYILSINPDVEVNEYTIVTPQMQMEGIEAKEHWINSDFFDLRQLREHLNEIHGMTRH